MMNRILSELSVQIYWNVHIGFSQLNDKWDLSENSVSILFVGDGSPVPLHNSLFTVSPHPFGRFFRLLREAKRLPYALTNWNLSGRQNMSFRTSAHTGVGISIEFQAAHRHTVCSNLPFPGIHSRKVVRLTGGLPRQCALLYRNDREFDKFQFARA